MTTTQTPNSSLSSLRPSFPTPNTSGLPSSTSKPMLTASASRTRPQHSSTTPIPVSIAAPTKPSLPPFSRSIQRTPLSPKPTNVQNSSVMRQRFIVDPSSSGGKKVGRSTDEEEGSLSSSSPGAITGGRGVVTNSKLLAFVYKGSSSGSGGGDGLNPVARV